MKSFNLSRPTNVPDDAGTQLMGFRDDFNRLFDEFFRTWGFAPWTGGEFGLAFTPKVNIRETDDGIEVTAELPGMTATDVDVSFKDNVLVLRGEKKFEREETKANMYRVERSYGRFERAITMPAEVEPDRIDAQFKDGVLTVTLAKSKTATSAMKKIAIKS